MKYLKNVVTLNLDQERCHGCGRCTEVCPRGVFEAAAGPVRVADRDSCLECGACALNCPAGALTVKAGVGCASAVIKGWLTGREPSCGCSGSDCC